MQVAWSSLRARLEKPAKISPCIGGEPMGPRASADVTHGERPLLRGTLHQGAFMVALVVGTLLVAEAHRGRPRLGAAVFAASVVTMLGVSALYHRVTWGPRVRPWMRRVDHAGIYLLIAGTYTPVGLLSLHGTLQRVTLAIIWAGAAVRSR